jgi:ComF family protein
MGKEEALQVGVIARALLDCLVSVLLAPPCAACGASLEEPLDGPVCPACWRSIAPVASPFRIEEATICRAAGIYAGALSAIVHALKYQQRTSLAKPLGDLIARHCGDALSGADLVVPVPLHRSRQRERGFNQAALLARALPLPCADALARVRATPSQTDLPAHKRKLNVKGAFALSREAGLRVEVSGRCVVLVDDVATTGATLSECAKVLREAGAREVRAVTAARAL